nr:sporulation membrane protein YtaF [Paenibacillus baekrokdamisoli]
MLVHAASLILLAFAVSLDGFGVGVTYGMRRIRIPILSVVIIALCSGIVVWVSMQIGAVLSGYMSPMFAKGIGAVLLMLIGCWALYQYWRRSHLRDSDSVPVEEEQIQRQEATLDTEEASTVLILELKRLGLVIQILRTPQMADVDRSGIISASEALLLGIALSLDSFGAGLGAAMIGFSPILTAVVLSTTSGLFLLAGMKLGFKFAAWQGMRALSILPGILLFVMGLVKLL